MTERLTIQLAYHLWAEATSSHWVWTDADEVQGQLRCYQCGLPSSDVYHTGKGFAPIQTHPYEPGVLVATDTTTCPTCKGSGWHPDRIAKAGDPFTDPCPDCGGSGITEAT